MSSVKEHNLLRRIEPHMRRIGQLVGGGYAVTLIARWRGPAHAGGDIVLTDETLPEAARALARRAARDQYAWSDLVECPWLTLHAIVDVAAAQLQDVRSVAAERGVTLRILAREPVAVLRWAARLDWCLVARRVMSWRGRENPALEARIKQRERALQRARRSALFR